MIHARQKLDAELTSILLANHDFDFRYTAFSALGRYIPIEKLAEANMSIDNLKNEWQILRSNTSVSAYNVGNERSTDCQRQ